MAGWEPWSGCYGVSEGCKYCYYYGPYSKRYGQNVIVRANDNEFYKPLETVYMPRKKVTKQTIPSGKSVGVCFASDFLLEEADEWRKEAWSIIKERSDLTFLFLTKRIDRFHVSLPDDWGDAYDNVEIGCGIENQETADHRLPLFLKYPIKHRSIQCAPLLGKVDLRPYLHDVEYVLVHGEVGREARECNFDWVLDIRDQCASSGAKFKFWGSGSRFRKDGILHKISPYMQKKTARDIGINIGFY